MKKKDRTDWARLCGPGYFPEELPPCFTANSLGEIILEKDFDLSKLVPNAKTFIGKMLPFSIPRIKQHRRILGIPNPINHALLSEAIIVNKKEIYNLIETSTYTTFQNPDNGESKRYLLKPDYKEFTEQKIIRSTGYRYVLSVDINRFYPSIYTHSIPWAIHGKSLAKKNTGDEYFGNLLDKLCRNAQDRQTMGIPIGPDTSRIISELILSAIDKEISETLINDDFACVRHVDDYFLYFKSKENSEKARRKLENALRKYELELNINKERITELPELIETEWRTAIRSFRIRNKKQFERTDLIAYFDLCVTLARKYPNDAVTSYGIAKLRGHQVTEQNWDIFQSLLLNCLVLESKTIELVIRELLHNKKEGLLPNRTLIKKALDSFLNYHLEHSNRH